MKISKLISILVIQILFVGSTYCQIGNDSIEDVYKPILVFPKANGISAGYDHSLILSIDNKVYGTGNNDYFQIGTIRSQKTYNVITGCNNVKYIYAGQRISYFIDNEGFLWGFGGNGFSELGIGDKTINAPKKLLENVKKVSSGYAFSFVLKNDGTVWGIGNNDKNQICKENIRVVKEYKYILDDIIDISSGYDFSLLLRKDGSLWAVGSNGYGEFGNGTFDKYTKPQMVISSGVKKIAARNSFAVIIKDDNSVWACGDNRYSEFGFITKERNDGKLWDIEKYTKIFDKAVEVAAGESTIYIIDENGVLWGAGNDRYNYKGQLGINSKKGSTTFQKITTNVINISAGYMHLLILKNDGSVWACG